MFLNNSSAAVYETCMRKGFWSREYKGLGGPGGIRPEYADTNLQIGIFVHMILAYIYQGKPAEEAVELAIEDFKQEFGYDDFDYKEQEEWEEWFEWGHRFATEYETYRQANDKFQVQQIEAEGCVVLGEVCYECGEPYPEVHAEALLFCPECKAEVHHWVFRVDLLISDGNYAEILDHKTTKSASDNYIESWKNSFQLWGYCYGFQKATGGLEIAGYVMNIIRKLKTLGTEAATMKQCPSCRNGSKKKLGCDTCNGKGKVLRELSTADQPFQRADYGFTEEEAERFVRQRIGTIKRILHERAKFEHEPDEAWPMNPGQCYAFGKCPFIKLCYNGDPERWYEPSDLLLQNYVPNEEDYVSVRQLAREEMK